MKISMAAWGAVVLFVATRVWVGFGCLPKVSDTELYCIYGFVTNEAHRLKKSPYDIYDRGRRRSASSQGETDLKQHQLTIEYPPLALALFWVPARLVPESISGSGLRGNGPRDHDLWKQHYRTIYFAVELLTVLGIGWILHRRKLASGWGLFVGTLGGVVMAYVLYDRLDLWLGLLLLGATAAAVVGRRHWAMVLLALGVSLKLVPLLLLPIFVLGALPAERPSLRAAITSCGVFAVAVLALFLPFPILWGPRAWDFLAFHGERGLQIESTWSSLLLTASHLGYPARAVHEHGSGAVVAPGSHFLAKATTFVVLATTGLVTWLYWRTTRRPDATTSSAEPEKATIAARDPQRFVWATMAALALSLAGSKVFSPQYVCWFLPLFLMIESPRGWRTALTSLAFLVACVLTMIVFPVLSAEMENFATLTPLTLKAPSLRAVLVNLCRNLVWIGFAVGALITMLRGAQPAIAPPEKPKRKPVPHKRKR